MSFIHNKKEYKKHLTKVRKKAHINQHILIISKWYNQQYIYKASICTQITRNVNNKPINRKRMLTGTQIKTNNQQNMLC